MSNNGYSMRPLAVWEDATHFKVGPVCDPQEKGRALALVPKSSGPNAKTYANLIKQLLFKWHQEYEKPAGL